MDEVNKDLNSPEVATNEEEGGTNLRKHLQKLTKILLWKEL